MSSRYYKCFGLWLEVPRGTRPIDFASLVLEFFRTSRLVNEVYLTIRDEFGNDVCILGSFPITSDRTLIEKSCNINKVGASRPVPNRVITGDTPFYVKMEITGSALLYLSGLPNTQFTVYVNGQQLIQDTLKDPNNTGIGTAGVVIECEAGTEIEVLGSGIHVIFAEVPGSLLRTLTVWKQEIPIDSAPVATGAQIHACYADVQPPKTVNSYSFKVLPGW